jgi:hypothetical protein
LDHVNEPLNADMRRVIDAIEHLPGRQAAPQAPAEERVRVAPDTGAVAEVEPSHLFISAYTRRGKPH